ncbi:hypothetical protein IKF76_00905 [Candidatus Saccharibacteria bacterium]|nr:hypothetical protein [Candidatus Saccharibacteria bacterium]
MDNQTFSHQIVEPSTGSSVIVEPTHADSDQAGDFLRQIAAKKARRPKWVNNFSALPKKQRVHIILASIFSFSLIVAASFSAVAITAVNIDYSESYRVAKELRVEVQALRTDYACQKVLDYVDSPYTTMASFSEYVEKCHTTGNGSKALVEALSLTEAVRKDDELAKRYDSFYADYLLAISDSKELDSTLKLYTIWHQWVISAAALDGWDQTDTALEGAAKILIDSGDNILKNYAEAWLARKKSVAIAYREYYFSSMTDLDRRLALQKDMEAKQREFTEFEAQSQPNIKELDVLEMADTGKLYSRFEDMYDYIRKAYQAHYERGSGDCKELLTEVVCD